MSSFGTILIKSVCLLVNNRDISFYLKIKLDFMIISPKSNFLNFGPKKLKVHKSEIVILLPCTLADPGWRGGGI